MSRFSPIKIEHDLQAVACEEFIRTLAAMDSSDAFRELFLGLFSKTELVMFARRLHAARLLLSGETYKTVGNKLKMSEDTVRNVAHRVLRGGDAMKEACGILEKVIPEIHEEISRAFKALSSHGYERLKKNYSRYHLIENLMDVLPQILREKRAGKRRKKPP